MASHISHSAGALVVICMVHVLRSQLDVQTEVRRGWELASENVTIGADFESSQGHLQQELSSLIFGHEQVVGQLEQELARTHCHKLCIIIFAVMLGYRWISCSRALCALETKRMKKEWQEEHSRALDAFAEMRAYLASDRAYLYEATETCHHLMAELEKERMASQHNIEAAHKNYRQVVAALEEERRNDELKCAFRYEMSARCHSVTIELDSVQASLQLDLDHANMEHNEAVVRLQQQLKQQEADHQQAMDAFVAAIAKMREELSEANAESNRVTMEQRTTQESLDRALLLHAGIDGVVAECENERRSAKEELDQANSQRQQLVFELQAMRRDQASNSALLTRMMADQVPQNSRTADADGRRERSSRGHHRLTEMELKGAQQALARGEMIARGRRPRLKNQENHGPSLNLSDSDRRCLGALPGQGLGQRSPLR